MVLLPPSGPTRQSPLPGHPGCSAKWCRTPCGGSFAEKGRVCGEVVWQHWFQTMKTQHSTRLTYIYMMYLSTPYIFYTFRMFHCCTYTSSLHTNICQTTKINTPRYIFLFASLGNPDKIRSRQFWCHCFYGWIEIVMLEHLYRIVCAPPPLRFHIGRKTWRVFGFDDGHELAGVFWVCITP